jgi:ferredoxin--NADP+ reductase
MHHVLKVQCSSSGKVQCSSSIETCNPSPSAQATGETCNIVIDHEGNIPFHEGQSYGIIPPGTKVNSRGKEMPHGVRLYSIASSRYGDEFNAKTTTLCVRRATYWDEEMGKEVRRGVCLIV